MHDFLERIRKETAVAILEPAKGAEPAKPHLNFYAPKNNPFRPVEFSGAVTGVPIFAAADKPGPLDHFGGFRRLPAAWTIDWPHFFKTSAGATPQLSRKIDASIAGPLFKLPGLPGERPSLPLPNLKRGLWFYLLREAATLGKGERLGMVGGRIVAEVLVGLLAATRSPT